ncbi:retrotransposon protein putative Ty3-gypsy subclass, partial [Trifolium medium]|nr:retrotransposon protein putative Ty3-gypsy subclass [Trifolium medium]
SREDREVAVSGSPKRWARAVTKGNGIAVDPSKTCEESFQELKQKLTSAPMLTLSDSNESFVVYCDASKMGLGGVLMQKGKVVAYASRQLKVHDKLPDPRLRIGSCGIRVEESSTTIRV